MMFNKNNYHANDGYNIFVRKTIHFDLLYYAAMINLTKEVISPKLFFVEIQVQTLWHLWVLL